MSDKIEPGKKMVLRVDLQPEIAEILKKIMDERKFQYFSNAIRYCIIETHNRTEFKLEDVYAQSIDRVLAKPHLKNKFLISNKQQFINKAIEHYLEYIDENSPSIANFDIRSKLSDEELEIAIALLECQASNPTGDTNIVDLMKYLNMRNKSNLERILEDFVRDGIVDTISRDGQVYYHAADKE